MARGRGGETARTDVIGDELYLYNLLIISGPTQV